MQLHKNTFTAQDAILESEENYLASVYVREHNQALSSAQPFRSERPRSYASARTVEHTSGIKRKLCVFIDGWGVH